MQIIRLSQGLGNIWPPSAMGILLDLGPWCVCLTYIYMYVCVCWSSYDIALQEYQQVLDLMRDIILATDVAHHLRILPQLEQIARGE